MIDNNKKNEVIFTNLTKNINKLKLLFIYNLFKWVKKPFNT